MGVDFVKSDRGSNQPKGNGYDVEYTDPKAEDDIPKVKHGNLLGWMSRGSNSGSDPVPPVQPTQQATAPKTASADLPSTQVRGAAAYHPVSGNVPAAPKPVNAVTAPSAPLPVTTKFTERHLPPPPPPPVHSVAPVLPIEPAPVAKPSAATTPAPRVVSAPQPVVAPSVTPLPQPVVTAQPVTPVMAPAMPAVPVPQPEPVKITHVLPPPPPAPDHTVQPVKLPNPQATVLPVPPSPVAPSAPAVPMAPAPITSAAMASAPMASQRHVTSVGEIVAQNVSGMRGETTHPDILEPESVGVNLLPNASSQSTQQSALYRLLRASTLMMIFCTLIYLAMVGYQGFFIWRTHTTLSELTDLDNQILTYRTLQADINRTSMTLTTIQDLLNEHLYWSQWFTFLEEYTLPTVYYSSFSGSATGTMNLQAVAPDFTTISQQIAVLEALPEVLDVTVTTATRGDTNFADTTGDTSNTAGSTVQFTLSLQVDPAILHFQPNGLYE